MAKLPPMSKGKSGRKRVLNQTADGKVAGENLTGRPVPRGGFTDETKGKSAGSGNVRKTGGSESKGS
jgi:hypothetical protein